MLKKTCCFLLAAVLLFVGIPTATAQTVLTGDLSSDGDISLQDTMQLFYALNGHHTLSPLKTALGDSNFNGTIDLNDTMTAFYRANGADIPSAEAVAFSVQYHNLSDNACPLSAPLLITDSNAFRDFSNLHSDVSYYMWNVHVDLSVDSLIVVPIGDSAARIAAVSAKGDTLYVSEVTARDAANATDEQTVYAFIRVSKAIATDKTVRVINYVDNTAKTVETEPFTFNSHYSAGNIGCQSDLSADAAGGVTASVIFTMPYPGYAITDARYTVTEDTIFLECDIAVPLESDFLFCILDTIGASVPIAEEDYHGQELIVIERRRERDETIA